MTFAEHCDTPNAKSGKFRYSINFDDAYIYLEKTLAMLQATSLSGWFFSPSVKVNRNW